MNTSLTYNESGQGPVVLLIHGFCESREIWKDFQDHFSKNFRVISPDLPGFGESNLSQKEISIEFYAGGIYDLLKMLQVEKCAMIGHSLGGYVTLAFAELYPSMLQGIGLFHSTAYADTEEKKENRNKSIEFIDRQGSQVFADSFVAPLFYEKNREKNRGNIERLIQIAGSTSKESIIAATKAMRDRKERIQVLKGIQVPVMFIAGKQDTAIPFEKSREQCHLPEESHVCFLSDCGHMGMFEKKEETKKVVECFLNYLNS